MRLPWADFKNFIDANGITPQYVDVYGTYWIKAFHGPFEVECQIDKYTPASADQDEFESNYIPTANKPVSLRVQQTLGDDFFTLLFKGQDIIQAPANTQTVTDFVMSEAYAIQGGMLAVFGGQPEDTISMEIVDVDNLLGAGAGFVLATYVDEAGVVPNFPIIVEDVSLGFLPAPGLYVRVTYNNNGAASAKVRLNLKLFTTL